MNSKQVELKFGARSFPFADFLWGLERAQDEADLAKEALLLGAQLVQSDFSSNDAVKFCESVCRWGRGERVFANLKRHHGTKLGNVLSDALTKAMAATDDETAIAALCAIKGLGVSFASKHLRMIHPQRFGVLDSRFQEKIGFAMNAAGYGLFMKYLREFHNEASKHAPTQLTDIPIGMIENGLFFLVQPKAIAQMERERTKFVSANR